MLFHRAYQQLKNIYHFFQAHAWRIWYGFPDQDMKIYGVTGTNGKTTTCHLLAEILEKEFGAEKVGMLTTIAFRVGNKREVNETKLTTLPSRLVYSYLREMKQAGVKHVVVEITSHALDQNRLAGICLDGAIILNIAREHLDYHQTMEQYAVAKLRIIEHLKPGAPLVVKGDDEWIKRILFPLLTPAGRSLGEGWKEGWIPPRAGDGVVMVQNAPSLGAITPTLPRSAREYSPFVRGRKKLITFTSQQAKNISTPLEGDVNKENALAARLLARAVGISQPAIDAGIASVTHVPGRMEWIEGKGFKIIIDYAVTPDALERLYAYVKTKTSGRVLGLLGAAGLRDRGKRPDMARTVAKYADMLVITREDPWTESEEQIFSDLEKGLVGEKVRWHRIPDRREALAYLMNQAKPGDTIVVTGKGAETGMGIGKKIVPWSDRHVIEEILV